MDIFHRALVVDDDQDICRTVTRYLTEKGIDSVYALDGTQALRLFERERFDVVISDLRMPKLHGHALVREIFKRSPDQLVAVMTGIEEPQLIHDLLSRGVRLVIAKPFSLDYFAANILGILEHQQSLRKAKEKTIAEVRGDVAGEIKNVTTSLTQQLSVIQGHFKHAIRELEEQQMDLERDYIGSVRMMAELMETVRQGSSSHVSRVEEVSRRIGDQVNLSSVEARHLSLAALMHDIGKFGLPDRVLHARPEEMTSEEFASYRKHPMIGGIVVASVPGLSPVGAIIEDHHENFDGSGFPAGRKGAGLPVTHRILRVADGLDRYLEGYGKGYEPDWAVGKEHLMGNAGKLYDRTLARHAVRALADMAQERETYTVVDLKPSELRPGMRLAMDIMHDDDVFLLRRGVMLTPRSVQRLQQELELAAKTGWIRVSLLRDEAAAYASRSPLDSTAGGLR